MYAGMHLRVCKHAFSCMHVNINARMSMYVCVDACVCVCVCVCARARVWILPIAPSSSRLMVLYLSLYVSRLGSCRRGRGGEGTHRCGTLGRRRAPASSPCCTPAGTGGVSNREGGPRRGGERWCGGWIRSGTSAQSPSLAQRQFSVHRHAPSVHDTTRPSVMRHSQPGHVSQLFPQVTSARQWPSSSFLFGAPLLLKV